MHGEYCCEELPVLNEYLKENFSKQLIIEPTTKIFVGTCTSTGRGCHKLFTAVFKSAMIQYIGD